MKKLFAAMALALFTALSPQVQAEDPIYTGVFSNKAVGGYDTVAYFTQGKPVEGKEEFQTTYKGAEWLFSSKEHLDMFTADPEKYAPQYGGYCAFALGFNESLVSTSPKAWNITDGKLYLNYNKRIQKRWEDDKANLITEADALWPNILEE